MPTYQYSCTECEHSFEQFQSFSEDSLTVCPACDGRLRKVFNAVGVVFKGSGFYRTDSRSTANGSEGGGTGSEGTDTKTVEKKDSTTTANRSTSKGSTSNGSTSSTSSTADSAA